MFPHVEVEKDPVVLAITPLTPTSSACLLPLGVLAIQSYLTPCYLVDNSPPGSSAHGILQARILEWVAISSCRGSSQPRDRTCVSCIAGKFLTTEPPGKPYCLLRNATNPIQREMAGVTGETSDGDGALGGGENKVEHGCVKTYVWTRGRGKGVICLQFLLESLLLIFNKYYLSTYYLLHADCAPLTGMGTLYLFFLHSSQ